MLIMRDLYTQVESFTIATPSQVTLGQTVIQYEVKEYTDTRNLGDAKSYIVSCTQRLILPNQTPYSPTPETTTGFLNYPAMMMNNIAISDPNSVIASKMLMDYSPRTLNTAVSSSQSSSQSSSASYSQQYTSGSSTAQTNSYGVSASLGFFGDAPTGDISGSYGKSTTNERSTALSRGNAVDQGSQLSNSAAMSIKDWGTYASVDMHNTTPTWVSGQEYPWNVIQLKNTNASGNVVLPAYVVQRLYDGQQVYPPSELSLFGIDVVAKATWLITLNPADAAQAESIAFVHTLTYCTATHSLVESGGSQVLQASIDAYPAITVTSQSLDLAVLALDPLVRTGSSSQAVVGFVLNKFDVAPSATGGNFAITADANNLLVRGSGFNGIMTTGFATGTPQMTAYFKMTDANANISLSLKHWVTADAPVKLTIVVNGDTNATITRFVDSAETGSGGDNVMVIALRNKDFASVDYCDYLQLGLNTVSISFAPVNAGAASYQILAMAVG